MDFLCHISFGLCSHFTKFKPCCTAAGWKSRPPQPRKLLAKDTKPVGFVGCFEMLRTNSVHHYKMAAMEGVGRIRKWLTPLKWRKIKTGSFLWGRRKRAPENKPVQWALHYLWPQCSAKGPSYHLSAFVSSLRGMLVFCFSWSTNGYFCFLPSCPWVSKEKLLNLCARWKSSCWFATQYVMYSSAVSQEPKLVHILLSLCLLGLTLRKVCYFCNFILHFIEEYFFLKKNPHHFVTLPPPPEELPTVMNFTWGQSVQSERELN